MVYCNECAFWTPEKRTDLGVCSFSRSRATIATDGCLHGRKKQPPCDVIELEPEEIRVVICSCELCKHFAAAEQGPLGTCRRYPRPEALLDVKGCGEFRVMPDGEHITE